MKLPVSVQILTQNSAGTVRETLQSVQWADEIQVVDGGSTDTTLDLAREYGAKIVPHPYENYGNQQNWGLTHLSQPWVLVVDSDEHLSPELQREIQDLFQKSPDCDGYFIKRRSFFLGRLINHGGWERDTVLRLFRREKGRFRVRNVHSDGEVDGKLGTLENVMYHRPYDNLSAYLQKFQRYTTWGALEFDKQGRKFSWKHLLLHPPARWFRMYLLRGGFLDGTPGFILSVLSMFYVFMKYAKVWEIQRNVSKK